jgi:hypothetical protein
MSGPMLMHRTFMCPLFDLGEEPVRSMPIVPDDLRLDYRLSVQLEQPRSAPSAQRMNKPVPRNGVTVAPYVICCPSTMFSYQSSLK